MGVVGSGVETGCCGVELPSPTLRLTLKDGDMGIGISGVVEGIEPCDEEPSPGCDVGSGSGVDGGGMIGVEGVFTGVLVLAIGSCLFLMCFGKGA